MYFNKILVIKLEKIKNLVYFKINFHAKFWSQHVFSWVNQSHLIDSNNIFNWCEIVNICQFLKMILSTNTSWLSFWYKIELA